MKKAVVIIIYILLSLMTITSEEYLNKSFGYYVDIPEGWKLNDDTNEAIVSFANELGQAVYQVYVFKGEAFSTVDDIKTYIKKSFKAEGDEDGFKYQGNDSLIADYTFTNGRFNVRGYFIFIKAKDYNYVLASYSTVDTYSIYHEFLLSCIDSFSMDKGSKLYSGPLNQYYYQPSNKKINVDVVISNNSINYSTDEKEIEATEVLIERESKILATYNDKENRYKAWKRYYKIIYRDNYQKILPFTESLTKKLKLNTLKKEETSQMLVSWVQGFTYRRDEDSNDLLSPLEALVTLSGDCDSKALLLNIIFHQLEIDAIMVVSELYKHSGIILNINASGAKFNFNDKPYYYAELNAKVNIGKIDQKMSDENYWMAIDLKEK